MNASRLTKFVHTHLGRVAGRPAPYQLLRRHRSIEASPSQAVDVNHDLYPRPSQTTDTVFMVSPRYFNMNPATAVDNKYQTLPSHLNGFSGEEISALALQEFDGLVTLLRKYDVRVLVVEPLEEHRGCSDAVFPNNWVSFHEGRIALYPMKAENRRKERRLDVVKQLSHNLRAEVVDYTSWEKENKFLEGTGSMVLDRVNKISYACISQRTDPEVLAEFCRDFDYKAVTFEAFQMAADGQLWPVYHTNVICSAGDTFALLCTESIRDEMQRRTVVGIMEATGKVLVDISEDQVYQFAANSLQLHSTTGRRLLVMSTAAFKSLRADQLQVLRSHVHHILHTPLPTIEALGGGGARCMQTEVFSN